jgi:hypothetical protein
MHLLTAQLTAKSPAALGVQAAAASRQTTQENFSVPCAILRPGRTNKKATSDSSVLPSNIIGAGGFCASRRSMFPLIWASLIKSQTPGPPPGIMGLLQQLSQLVRPATSCPKSTHLTIMKGTPSKDCGLSK